ncbi:uncharacterized protein MONOS_8319 [Monocercomonoides exilis]|uniref:uncharacterized protein n=1 Tax=Monocercomonoides exilis TaxID=2049356 RepID=UPI0035598A37|nr:hypothetical protein MONOS_8319 [Monocercomonoides exilis]|eukprot:MONOS_8319.1-p1 / transcript=MONOS_8319.1 / gene=MONOS_8319 / organism=Monocercomonoides_exilis_PA203 / gene_product=unspecified product / transcript_product=unspecified product / location=Mono_scaffold00311:44802-45466(-) / protein_length=150 / sequence_SO=supercontig / SO=protein_coding / is_pseudo=false
MIFEEEKKKEEKDDYLLVDLCESFVLLNDEFTSTEFLSICVPCLLKVALRKEEIEEVQKEVEMALLALSSIRDNDIEKELFLDDMTEIMKYHQEHRNLTRLAYQSAWQFLINRLFTDKRLEDMIVNELHFGREASRELEELSKSISSIK